MHPFEWDPSKALVNELKHGVSFEEAQTVFFDEEGLQEEDSGHSARELRFLFLGLSVRERLLVVSHCYRERHETIRIISARKATRREQTIYAVRGRT